MCNCPLITNFLQTALLLGLAGRVVSGAELAPPALDPLTPEQLVTQILADNPELKFYEAELAAARADRRTAGTWPNPELSTEVGQKRTRAGSLSEEGAAWSVSVQQPFEWPGRLSLRKAIANQQVALAELGLAQFKTALAARARSLTYHLAAAEEKAHAARSVADRLAEIRAVIVQRDPAGLTPLLEARIIEATELTLQRKATQEQLAAQSALLELNFLRGQPGDEPLRIHPAGLSFKPAPAPRSLAAAARTNNFELRMRESELRQQGLKLSLARKEAFPQVSVGPFYSSEDAGEHEQIIGLGLSMPLPLWNRQRGQIDAAAARQEQATTLLLLAERALDRKIIELSTVYEAKLNEMGRWRRDSLAEFRKAADLADRHYRLGAVPVATYVELQKQYLDAIDALLESEREALDAAQQLELLTGLSLQAAQPAQNLTQPSQP